MLFAEIKNKNLEGKSKYLPYELEGKANIVIIPFKRFQKMIVDDWAEES